MPDQPQPLYALRKPSSIFFGNHVTLDDLKARVESGQIGLDWRIWEAPDGEETSVQELLEALAKPAEVSPAPVPPGGELPAPSQTGTTDELLRQILAETVKVKEQCAKTKWAVRGIALLFASILIFGVVIRS